MSLKGVSTEVNKQANRHITAPNPTQLQNKWKKKIKSNWLMLSTPETIAEPRFITTIYQANQVTNRKTCKNQLTV